MNRRPTTNDDFEQALFQAGFLAGFIIGAFTVGFFLIAMHWWRVLTP